MADKRIDQLTEATNLTAVDLLVTEQSGIAKKVTGDVLANSSWNMMQKDVTPIEDSTAPITSGAVASAIAGNIDETLSVQGKAADAKATGDAVGELARALTSNVSELKGNQSLLLTSEDFVNGEIQASTGNVTPGTATRLMTRGFHAVSPLKPFYLTILPSGKFSSRLIQYDSELNYVTGGNLTSRTLTLNSATRYVRFVLWDGSNEVSPDDVQSVSFVTYANDIDVFPNNILDNLYNDEIITIDTFVSGQYYDRRNSGNIKADVAKSRSYYLYKAKGGMRYISELLNDAEIIFFDENYNYLDYIPATGATDSPQNAKYMALNVSDSAITNATVYILDTDTNIDRTIRLDVGGILDSNGRNAFIYEKNPISYRRTTKYIKLRKGKPFRATFTGSLYVFEYSSGLVFLKKGAAISGKYYFPDRNTEFIKFESYVAPAFISQPSIIVGNKYSDGYGTQWEYDTSATNRFYTDVLTLDHSKKYLMTVDMENVFLAYEYTLEDGSPMKSFGFLNGNPIIDCLTYLTNGEKIMMRGRISGGSFSDNDKPFSIYELNENTNLTVLVRMEWDVQSATQKNKRYGYSELGLVYEVKPLLNGIAPSELCYTSGLIKLPPNYSQNGNPVPLIYFAHGSADYTTIDTNVLSPSTHYADYIEYLCDEGFAIFDCYGWSNLFSFAGGGQWAGHIGMACVTSGIQHVLENYNIDPKRIYATSKSLGGLQALNMATFGGVNAIAPLAPAVDSFETCLGYDYAQRIASFYDFGLDAGTNDVNIKFGKNVYMYNSPELFREAILSKPDATIGYNPAWNAMADIDPVLMINAELNGKSFQSGALNVANIIKTKSRFTKAPVKIWVASDDNTVSYRLCAAYIQTVKNAGGIAELRTMPDNTGGHHSVDNDPNAPKVASITTALGISHTNVPVAYVEMVQWFRQYE